MAIQTPLHVEHQLDQLAGQFAHWRQTRPHPHSPIPAELWAHAVALTAVVPPSRVAQQLRLRLADLKKQIATRHGSAHGAASHLLGLCGSAAAARTAPDRSHDPD